MEGILFVLYSWHPIKVPDAVRIPTMTRGIPSLPISNAYLRSLQKALSPRFHKLSVKILEIPATLYFLCSFELQVVRQRVFSIAGFPVPYAVNLPSEHDTFHLPNSSLDNRTVLYFIVYYFL